ncbi:retrovirus-related pol polyprotein from transposon 17.6 [Tanacetum coccineum]
MHRLRKATRCHQQNDSLAIAGPNLFDGKASYFINSKPKITPPIKSLREYSSPNSSGFQNPIVLPIEQTRKMLDSQDVWLIKGLKPTRMSIQLVDRSIKYPIGACEILLVKINKFIFLVDFVVLEMDEDETVPIILGRPFIATTHAVIDFHDGKLSLRVGKEIVTLNIGKYMRVASSRDDYLYCFDHTANLHLEENHMTCAQFGKKLDKNSTLQACDFHSDAFTKIFQKVGFLIKDVTSEVVKTVSEFTTDAIRIAWQRR